ncbi:ATP-dependent endonuclease [Bradyrhizobium guangdongense]|nr:ATP-dependent endonuclease [Bradyrhizobium guangdongense]
MARIRHIEIRNFRCIQSLNWFPSPGINCLVGPGDSGKSSILDAIDLCLGARRNVLLTDADFYSLNVEQPISITITIGELDDALKSLEAYGAYLRSFNAISGNIDDEPEAGGETVLTVNLSVGSDLEPIWTLVSTRAEEQGQSRFLTWGDRARLSPNRIGALADHNLAWRRGSVLNRLSEERADTSAALAKAARDARAAFGNAADAQLGETLRIVEQTAAELGIPVGRDLKAMLDAHSVSFSGGTIALHGANGVPLRALGVGSTRLLLAGLQRKAAKEATVILIDELEYGLEPHRIVRLLGSLGEKETQPPLQAFITTHSPIALRELSGDQLAVVRSIEGVHSVSPIGTTNDVQGTIRLHPEAFLAPSVLVCEGASEVGFIRGLDLNAVSIGHRSINAAGVSLVDARGISSLYLRAMPFVGLKYRVGVLRDDDVQPSAADEAAFSAAGGPVFKWRPGRSLEDEIFFSLSDAGISGLLAKAVLFHGEARIDAQIRTASANTLDLIACRGPVTGATRGAMARAAQGEANPWFKTVSRMEEVGRDIVGPDLRNAEPGFLAILTTAWQWMYGG